MFSTFETSAEEIQAANDFVFLVTKIWNNLLYTSSLWARTMENSLFWDAIIRSRFPRPDVILSLGCIFQRLSYNKRQKITFQLASDSG